MIHTAAVVSMYGAWEEYRRIGVVGTENVIAAAIDADVARFIHLGSVASYGFRHPHGVVLTEDMPHDEEPEPWNHYVREKMLTEKVIWRAHASGRIQVTSLRPPVVIGPRDRNVVTRMMNLLRLPFTGTIGAGTNRVGCVVVEELAEVAIRAATSEVAVGRAYNVAGREPITQRELYSLYAKAAGRRVQPFSRRTESRSPERASPSACHSSRVAKRSRYCRSSACRSSARISPSTRHAPRPSSAGRAAATTNAPSRSP